MKIQEMSRNSYSTRKKARNIEQVKTGNEMEHHRLSKLLSNQLRQKS